MAVSKYFRHINAPNEQELVDKLTIEVIQQRGMDVQYVFRTERAMDYLFGEDKNSLFKDYITIETWCEQMTGFEGDSEFMTKFGMDIRDEATFHISKTRFYEEISKAGMNTILRPREGDLIYFPLSWSVFEITFVEQERPFYTVGRAPVFKIITRRFQYNHEALETGIEDVDRITVIPEMNDSPNLETEDTDVTRPVTNWSESDPFSDQG